MIDCIPVIFYNNNSIFLAYEPGSVLKPIVMSAGVDLDLVGPETTFDDPCERKFDIFTIHNVFCTHIILIVNFKQSLIKILQFM